MNEDLIFDLCYPSWGTQDFDGRMEKPESGIRNPETETETETEPEPELKLRPG